MERLNPELEETLDAIRFFDEVLPFRDLMDRKFGTSDIRMIEGHMIELEDLGFLVIRERDQDGRISVFALTSLGRTYKEEWRKREKRLLQEEEEIAREKEQDKADERAFQKQMVLRAGLISLGVSIITNLVFRVL